jgi:pyruvate formate lyase activating enzyme
MTKGKIFNIQRFALHDGLGIRTTVFLKGCPLSCWWCCNPEGMNSIDGSEHGVGQEREVSVDELMREIEKDRVFYEQSGGGVTFSGGEPLAQPAFLDEMIERCKDDRHNYHVALDTSGYASDIIFREIASKVDLVLYDLKLISQEESLKYTGVPFWRSIENLSYLKDNGKRFILRMPIIPGITDTDHNLENAKELLRRIGSVEELDLLPYHRFAESKYDKMGLEYKLKGLEPPSAERMAEIKKFFEDAALKVKIGG